MDVKVNLKDGSTRVHSDAIFIGEIADRGELIVGSGFDVGVYPLSSIDGGSFSVGSLNKISSVEKLIEILQKNLLNT